MPAAHEITTTHDAAVVGAGPVGLTAAILLASAGARVVLFGPADANAGDTRTSALFSGSITALERAGVWPALRDVAAPMRAIRIVDRLSRRDYPSVVVFDSREVGDGPFGYNIPNPDLVRALEARFATFDHATRRTQTVVAIEHAADHVRLSGESGKPARVRLVVGADGSHSRARAAAGIAASGWEYGQTAIATRIDHETPHNDVSIEVHLPGGPLATVPLPGGSSAIVWLERPDAADRLCGLGDDAFAARLEAELAGGLRGIAMAGPRGRFPVRGLTVTTLAARRTALVGEAGHVLPPIGAQGLNLSLCDAAWIAGTAGQALARGADPGAERALAAYRRARAGDAMSRRAASDLLNRSLLFDDAALRGLRQIGLSMLVAFGPLRRALMRRGIARARDLPPAAWAGQSTDVAHH